MEVSKQKTLKGSFSLFGKGLHTGLNLTVTFNPAPENTGYRIQRIDLEGEPIIEAIAENVIDTQRGTVLAKQDARVSTVEHGMAALYALGIDNCLIQVNGPEFPILDGSSALYVKKIHEVGVVEQNARKDYYPLEGYEDLVTDADGIVPGVDQGLKAGTYYLTETVAPYGYDLGSPVKEVVFTISGDGKVTIEEGSSYTGSLSKEDVKGDSGDVIIRTDYTISVPNAEEGQIVPSGVVTGLWRAVGSLSLILLIIVVWLASAAVRRRTAR